MSPVMALVYYPERVPRSQHKEKEQKRSSLESHAEEMELRVWEEQGS